MSQTIQNAKQFSGVNDYTWELHRAWMVGYLSCKYRAQIEQFDAEVIGRHLYIDNGGISINGATREQLLKFLKIFGGDWDKNINDYYKDKMDYVQKIDDGVCEYMLEATQVEPPAACQIVEEMVEEPAQPARVVLKKRIVCPSSEVKQ